MNNDDELHAGVPRQQLRRPPVLIEKGSQRDDGDTLDLQQNTDVEASERQAGIPMQSPKIILSSRSASDDCSQVENELSDENITVPSSWSSVLHSPILLASILLIVSAFLLIILSESFQFVQAIQSATLPLRAVAYFCFGALLIAFGWSALRLVLTYRRLTTSPRVAIDPLNDAKVRSLIRSQLDRQLDSGYQSLRSIVERYPIDDKVQIALLKRSGCSEEDISTLRGNIRFLMESEPDGPGRPEWLKDCERLFVGVIDACAKRRVADYARRVAVKTAMMPNGLMDSLIVAVNAVLLVEELCRCYYVRASVGNSIMILARVVFSAFVAGRLEDSIDEAVNSLFGGVLSSIHVMAKEAIEKVSLGILKRTAEGTVNYALFYRLGAAAIVYLRPIRLK